MLVVGRCMCSRGKEGQLTVSSEEDKEVPGDTKGNMYTKGTVLLTRDG